jgi:hypothetical protein
VARPVGAGAPVAAVGMAPPISEGGDGGLPEAERLPEVVRVRGVPAGKVCQRPGQAKDNTTAEVSLILPPGA